MKPQSPGTSLRAVVLQHEAHEGLGLFEPALAACGFTFVRRFRQAVHADLDAELVVILGGPMSVTDTAAHPFLAEEQAFLLERLALGRPCLGLCLGAQLLASAAGAEVLRGKNGAEIGVGHVRLTKAGQDDPVLAGWSAKPTVAHWHEDTFTAVPDAALLASSDRYTQQAFRVGATYAFQFHLELTAADYERWLDGEGAWLASHGKDVAQLKAGLGKLRAAEADNRALVERLAHHFAKVARG